MSNQISFQPNWASSPGRTIADSIAEENISVNELASALNQTFEFTSDLIQGYRTLDEDLASRLEAVIGGSKKFWLAREIHYRNELRRLYPQDETSWLKELPVSEMIKLKWIDSSTDKLSSCLQFFGVPDIQTWKLRYGLLLSETAFRSSKTLNSNYGSVTAWMRFAELKSNSVQCESWDPDKFEQSLHEIRTLTRIKEPNKFLPLLVKICAACGVSVVIARAPAGCRASGATVNFVDGKPTIILSFRYLSDDQFWFTFFHEAGHVLLHREVKTFLDEDNIESTENPYEVEANIFAAECLIPSQYQDELVKLRRNTRSIVSFAMKLGVSPGIVVGQLQFKGIIDRKYLNSFKRRYSWDSINV